MKNRYSKTVGYSPLEFVDHDKLLQVVRVNKMVIDEYFLAGKEDMILVAGAGLGHEAVLVNKEFHLRTLGVDLNIDSNSLPFEGLDMELQKQDLASLAFDGGIFSLVYCYHVLEHVTDHMTVLKELYRVLKPGGVLFIGFPNRNRLISYIGTSQKASLFERIKWNINDYIYKMQGKFENRLGAHAGFTEREFIEDASSVFDTIYTVRNRYMLTKYPNFGTLLTWIIKTKMEEVVFPSNYFICVKTEDEHE